MNLKPVVPTYVTADVMSRTHGALERAIAHLAVEDAMQIRLYHTNHQSRVAEGICSRDTPRPGNLGSIWSGNPTAFSSAAKLFSVGRFHAACAFLFGNRDSLRAKPNDLYGKFFNSALDAYLGSVGPAVPPPTFAEIAARNGVNI